MKLNSRQISEKQSAILEAAKACFVAKGFHNTTMQDICSQAKMSAGNIYRYFDNKEAIIEAFAKDELQWMTTAIADVTSSPDLLQGIIDTAFWTAATLMQEGRSELMAELYAEAGRNPRINAIYTEFNKQLIDEICRSLNEIGESQALLLLHDSQSIANLIVALVDGIVLNRIINPDFDITAMRSVMETIVGSMFAKP